MMAPISTKPLISNFLTVAFIFALIILTPKSVVLSDRDHDDHDDDDRVGTKKMVLGSRPPRCVNKCSNCRPCTATLVIPSHQNKRLDRTSSSHREDDSYYLLSWKCACGNKLFHP